MSRMVERRRYARHGPVQLGLEVDAVLRPGLAVSVLDLSAGGALVDTAAAVRPGLVSDLHLTGAEGRAVVRVAVSGCWVASVQPLRYRARLLFSVPWVGADRPVDEGDGQAPG